MISQRAVNYAQVLDSLKLDKESVEAAKKLLLGCRELMEVLESPAIKKKEKEAVLDEIFDQEMSKFLKLLCENQTVGLFAEIMEAYDEIVLEHNDMMKARLVYAVKPEEQQLKDIKAMLCEKYKKSDVFLELKEDASLIGGYVLYVGDMEYNKSIKGALSEMQKTLIGR
ncbi:MAG TPA: ATP synthase F1 subunit delta [Clostridiales bacterium]|nr:ATP synthase F1 subunit delta [Clostridiales bacterium]